MRIFSNTQSLAKNEPTIMALFETLLAIALSTGIAVWYQTFAHIAFGACVAPLLLMRSPVSIAQGVGWFKKIIPEDPVDGDDPFLTGSRFLRILVLSAAIKIAATVSHPIKGVRNIPSNWFRVVLCTDLRTSVELLPGLGSARETLENSTTDKKLGDFGFLLIATTLFGTIGTVIFGVGLWFGSIISTILCGVIGFIFLFATLIFALGLACFLVAYLYRLSLKSTAIVWLPLLYVVHTAFDENVNLSVQLDEMRQSALWRLIRAISWMTLVLLAAKVAILPTIIDVWDSQPWASVVNVYVMPNKIHPWHVATGLNSAISLFGFYYFVDRAPRRMVEGIWSTSGVLHLLQAFTLVRGLISIYTISVGLYLTVAAAESMRWPVWSWKFVPW
jgi:hypothetical protein